MVEPEREIVRRALRSSRSPSRRRVRRRGPRRRTDAGWPRPPSAIVVVTANFVAHALSLGWAARISPTLVFAVGLGGFFLRMVVIVILLVVLNTLAWFSPIAFALSVVPATIVLLVFEARPLSGRMQADLWSVPARERVDRTARRRRVRAPRHRGLRLPAAGAAASRLFGAELCINFITFLVLLGPRDDPGPVLPRVPQAAGRPRQVAERHGARDPVRPRADRGPDDRARGPTATCRCSPRSSSSS